VHPGVWAALTLREVHGRGKAAPVQSVLPPELVQFLGRRTYSLLVKGDAATGKTILALSILREMRGGGDYLYLSTRVSPSQLFESHPWLAEFAKTERRFQGDRADELWSAERFVDARLDEPVPFFERMMDQLMDVTSPTIVVDSWDTIGVMMDEDALVLNAKVLQTWRERADAKIIVLIENSDDPSLDSLFDGVVTLDRYYEDGRTVRMMQLSKLSGVKVTRPSPLFTLDGGLFQSFRAYSQSEIARQKPEVWSWERRGESTGYLELDAMLDMTLPRGTLLSLHLAPGVNSAKALIVLSGIIGRGASRSRAAFFRPFEGVGFEQARGVLGELTLIEGAPQRAESSGSSGRAESLRGQLQKLNGARHGRKVVALTGSEFLLDSSGDDDRERLLELMKSEIDLSVLVSGNDASLENAARVADVSLKLSDINGTLLLRGQVPWTEYFVVCSNADRNRTTLGLVSMV
jgi:KaiC/GvpD/RAD55 family RecA-like ATPase